MASPTSFAATIGLTPRLVEYLESTFSPPSITKPLHEDGIHEHNFKAGQTSVVKHLREALSMKNNPEPELPGPGATAPRRGAHQY